MTQTKLPTPDTRLLIISTSKVHGGEYMSYLLDEVKDFIKDAGEMLFIPYACPSGLSYDEYTAIPRKAFKAINIDIKGIHEHSNPEQAIRTAEAIFVGGGNTFLLLKTLYEQGLIDVLRQVVAQGTPYMGSSAGSNITGLTIGTSNDMPIVYPPSFDALGFIPFNLNPHYLDPDPNSTHMGETRETRINEFHTQNEQPVLGLREGSWLRVENGELQLKGRLRARLFEKGQDPTEVSAGELNYLLK